MCSMLTVCILILPCPRVWPLLVFRVPIYPRPDIPHEEQLERSTSWTFINATLRSSVSSSDQSWECGVDEGPSHQYSLALMHIMACGTKEVIALLILCTNPVQGVTLSGERLGTKVVLHSVDFDKQMQNVKHKYNMVLVTTVKYVPLSRYLQETRSVKGLPEPLGLKRLKILSAQTENSLPLLPVVAERTKFLRIALHYSPAGN
ncbi:hypothetical protein BDR07DRAFT_1562306 [Suillus spraguei]|nr:hypothetical protein BDR07DRAFT_1562306 [Suillus spraguei]